MGLIHWEGWRELKKIQGEVNKFFDRVNATIGPESYLTGREPRVDLYQNDKEVIILVEIPGVENKGDLEIAVTDDTISIKGQIREPEEATCYRRERYYGTFSRTLTLPHRVLSEKAKANYSNGILEVRLLKAPKAQGKQVKLDLE